MITLSEQQQEEQRKNQEFARQLSRQTRADADSIYAGKYVGVLHQQVVAVADSWDVLIAQLDEMGTAADEAALIEASADHDSTFMIWSPRLLSPAETEQLRREAEALKPDSIGATR